MQEILVPGLFSLLTAISGFYYGTKKSRLDIEAQMLSNIQAQVAIYETLIDNLRNEVTILIQKVEEQKKTISSLQKMLDDIYKKSEG